MVGGDLLDVHRASSPNDDLRPNELSSEWFLAYDASCDTCVGLASSVDEVADGRLDIVSLYAPTVVAWRAEALGSNTSWTPTLLRVRGSKVEAWTGRGLVVRLTRLIGVRRAWQLAELLGDRIEATSAAPSSSAVLDRRRMLLGLSGVAAGLILANGLPESANADSGNACGIAYYNVYRRFGVKSGGGNCRNCPSFGSTINQVVPADTVLTFIEQSLKLSSTWYRSGGPAGCWMHESVLYPA